VAQALAVTFLLAALCQLPGLPYALALGQRLKTPFALMALEGLLFGLVFYLLVGLALIRLDMFSRTSLAVVALLVCVGGWAYVVLRHRDALQIPVRLPSLLLAAGPIAVLVIAILLRSHPTNFIYMTGDMGEYVNLANRAASGEGLSGSFPHMFTTLLALSSVLFGPAWTVSVLTFIGVVLLLTLAGTAARMEIPTIAYVPVLAAAALGVVPVWFSRFPVSESLYAVLLLGCFYALVALAATGSAVYVAAAAALVLAMGVTRATAFLIMPAIAVYGLVLCFTRDQAMFRRGLAFVGVGGAGLSLGLLYDFQYSTAYMQNQVVVNLGEFAPRLNEARLLEVGPPLAASLTLVILALLGLLLGIRRLASHFAWPERQWADASLTLLPIMIAAGGLAVAAGFFGFRGLMASGARYGVVLLGLAGLGLVVGQKRWSAYRPVLAFIAMSGSLGVVLFAKRLPEQVAHAYYLYWDRYLFSEAFPAVAALALLGAASLLSWVARRRFLMLAAGVVVVLGLVQLIPPTRTSVREELFDGSFEQVAALDRLTRGDGPIIYSGMRPPPSGWFFPNTFRAYALPLRLTFERQVLNIGRPPFEPDPVLDIGKATELAQANGLDEAWFVQAVSAESSQVQRSGSNGAWTWRYAGGDSELIPILPNWSEGQPPWYSVPLSFEVYALNRTESR
jgi:hypothetical protein